MLLVITDAHSKWPEVYTMSSTTANKTITKLRETFARYGLPEQLISDNGPQFVSEELETFLRVNGVKHIRSSPYHPASNGAAEWLVQTVKQALEAGRVDGVPLEQTLATFLLRYRATPHATTGVPPSTLLMGRTLRTRLDLIKPDVGRRVREQQAHQKTQHDTPVSDNSSLAREYGFGTCEKALAGLMELLQGYKDLLYVWLVELCGADMWTISEMVKYAHLPPQLVIRRLIRLIWRTVYYCQSASPVHLPMIQARPLNCRSRLAFSVAVIPHGSIDRPFVTDSETMGGRDVVYCVLSLLVL